MPRKDANTGHISAQAQQDLVSEGIENFELPKTIVTKIAKAAIPENAKLQKETILSLVKGSTVFINYLAATAHDVAHSKQHKSISASDVLKALELIEFGDLVEPLQAELLVYRDLAKLDKSKKGSANINNAQASSSASAPPNAKKAGSAAQPQQSASASAKAPGKVRVKNPKGAAVFSSVPDSGVPSVLPTNEVDVEMVESVSVHQDDPKSSDADQGDHLDDVQDEEVGDEGQVQGEDLVDQMQVEGEESRPVARDVEEQED